MSHPVWIRNIYFQPAFSGRPHWAFWQYHNRGTIEGIKTFVDLNVFSGGESDLQQFLRKPGTP